MKSTNLETKGFSLIELLVAVTISLILMLAIFSALSNTEMYKRATVGANNAQISGAIVMATLDRDIKGAGYGFASNHTMRCDALRYAVNGSVAPAGGLPALNAVPVRIGVGEGANGSDSLFLAAGTSTVRNIPSRLQRSMSNFDSPLEVPDPVGFSAGDVILVASGPVCVLRNVSMMDASGIAHSAGAKLPFNAPLSSLTSAPFPQGSLVFNLGMPQFHRYQVDERGLVVDQLLASALGTASSAVIASDVVDFRAQYGKDSTGNGVVDVFDNVAPLTPDEWARVLSIRVGILVRSEQFEKPDASGACRATTTPPRWIGGTFNVPGGLPSCYRFRAYESVMPLRNLIWSAA